MGAKANLRRSWHWTGFLSFRAHTLRPPHYFFTVFVPPLRFLVCQISDKNEVSLTSPVARHSPHLVPAYGASLGLTTLSRNSLQHLDPPTLQRCSSYFHEVSCVFTPGACVFSLSHSTLLRTVC